VTLFHEELPTVRQVSWLPDHYPNAAFLKKQWLVGEGLPGYSGGTARELHPVPYSPHRGT